MFQDPLYSKDLLMARFPSIITSNCDKWTTHSMSQIFRQIKKTDHIPDKSTFLQIFQYFMIRQPNLIPYTLQQRFAIEINPGNKESTIANILQEEFETNSWYFLGANIAAKQLKDIYGINQTYTKQYFRDHPLDNYNIPPPIPRWLVDISPNDDGVVYGQPRLHLQNHVDSNQLKKQVEEEWKVQNQMYQILHGQQPNPASLKELFFQFSPEIKDLHRFPIFQSIFHPIFSYRIV